MWNLRKAGSETITETNQNSTQGDFANQALSKTPDRDPEQLLDVAHAAALLSVKPKTLYAWVSRNRVPYRKVCSLGRFHRGELIDWTKAGMVK